MCAPQEPEASDEQAAGSLEIPRGVLSRSVVWTAPEPSTSLTFVGMEDLCDLLALTDKHSIANRIQ